MAKDRASAPRGKADPKAKGGKPAKVKAPRGEKWKQLFQAYKLTYQRDRQLPLWMAVAFVGAAAPEVFAHNLETVPRIFRRIRPGFRYERSLDVITQARDYGLVTKSNLILGMGETREEVSQALADLHGAGCEIITITQYLRPSVRHHPVERWVRPEEFVEMKEEAEEIGFAGVMSGPLVRSSYRAGRLYRQAVESRMTSATVQNA